MRDVAGATLPTGGKVQLYPNPTSSNFTIQAVANGTFYLYTMDGKELAQYTVTADANTFNIPKGLAAGVYMGKYRGEDGSGMVVRVVYEP